MYIQLRVADGDLIQVDGISGTIEALQDKKQRTKIFPLLKDACYASGRELFNGFRSAVSSADTGATIL